MQGPEHLLRSPPNHSDQKTGPRIFRKYADSQAPPRPPGLESLRETWEIWETMSSSGGSQCPLCERFSSGLKKPEAWVTPQDNHIRLLGGGDPDICCFLKFICWFQFTATGFSEKHGFGHSKSTHLLSPYIEQNTSFRASRAPRIKCLSTEASLPKLLVRFSSLRKVLSRLCSLPLQAGC